MGAKQPIRLTRRGRAVVVIAAVLAMLALGVGGRAAFAGGSAEPPRTVVVEPGDTLWSLAVEADPDADPRRVVARIIKINKLDGVIVDPGQVLILPG